MLQTNWEWVNQGNTDLSATKKRDFSEDNVMYIAILTSLVRLVIHIGSGAWPYINSCASQISKRSANLRRIETHQQLLGEPVSQWQNCNARGKTPRESTTIARPRTIESPDPKNHQMDLQTMDVSRPRKFCLDFCQEFEAWQYWQNTVCVTAGGEESFKAWMLGWRAYMHESACRSNYMQVLHQTFFSKADQFTLPNWCGFFL